MVAWLIIQVAETTFEGFGIPLWAFRFVMLCVILGFPIAIILAWAFELTPDGIKTTKVADQQRGDAPVSKKQERKRNWFSLLFAAAVPTLIFGTMALIFYFQAKPDQETILTPNSSLHPPVDDKSIAVLPWSI